MPLCARKANDIRGFVDLLDTSPPPTKEAGDRGDELFHRIGRNMRTVASRSSDAMAQAVHGRNADSACNLQAADFRVPDGRSAVSSLNQLKIRGFIPL